MPCTPFCSLSDDKPAGVPLNQEDTIAVCQASVVRGATVSDVAVAATPWWPNVTYPEGYVVYGSDDNNYVAVSSNTGNDPTDKDALYWIPVQIVSNLTIQVPSEISSLALAFAYIRRATIARQITVTIQVADGTYNLGTASLDLNHPDSDRIRLIGNTTTPASCILGFTALTAPPTNPYLDNNSGSLYKNDGNTFGLIDGFSIVRTGGTAAWGHCGILAYGSTINLGANMIVSDFFFQVAAAENGEVIAAGTGGGSLEVQTSVGASPGGYGIYANKGKITAPFLQISGTQNGVNLQEGSVARLNNFTTAAGLSDVFVLSGNSTLIAPNGTAGDASIYIGSIGSATIVDAGTTYGTASTGDIDMEGLLTRNGVLLSTGGAVFPFTLVTAGGLSVQRIVSGTESIFITDDGLNTEVLDLELAADGNQGINIEAATGNVQIPVSAEIGATAPFSGIQSDTVTLDGAGTATVPAPWITALSRVVVGANELTITGTLAVTTITPATSFVITSSAGAGDGGQEVVWIATVY